jgi:pathogenesis-related protein 1
MRQPWLVLWVLSGCGAVSSFPADAGVVVDAGPSLTTFQQALLTAHDSVRANAMPVPSPALPPMEWSSSAQALAEDWAARCNFEHRDPNSLGENLSAGTREFGGAEVVNDWAAEKADYTYSTNTCRPGKACGHYTQIVWRSSVGLGCAQQRCTVNSPFSGSSTWFFVVCDYDPAGNYIGQRPY